VQPHDIPEQKHEPLPKKTKQNKKTKSKRAGSKAQVLEQSMRPWIQSPVLGKKISFRDLKLKDSDASDKACSTLKLQTIAARIMEAVTEAAINVCTQVSV
jgi:hypothetical protein